MKKWVVISTKSIVIILLLGVISCGTYGYKCIDNAKSATVLIETQDDFGYSIGTGVIISETGIIVTAKHVVEDANLIRITLSDDRMFETDQIFLDSGTDLAVIFLYTDNCNYVEINESENYDLIYGIGTANGIHDRYLSFGYICDSNFKRMLFGDNIMLKMNMTIYPGCSGGGVYHFGKLVGIMTNSSRDGYSFAVSSLEIVKFLEEIYCAL